MTELHFGGDETPSWWWNFIVKLTKAKISIPAGLRQWGCTLQGEVRCEVSGTVIQPAMLIFKDEKDAALFLLRWM